MAKLNKRSSGVGKYLKYHKEKSTGGNLPNANQQPQAKIKPCTYGGRCQFQVIGVCERLPFTCYKPSA